MRSARKQDQAGCDHTGKKGTSVLRPHVHLGKVYAFRQDAAIGSHAMNRV